MGGDTRRKRRQLGPDERRLWQLVAATTEPLHGGDPVAATRIPTPERPAVAPEPPEKPFPERPPRGGSRDRAALRHAAGAPATVRLAPAEPGPVGRPEAGLDRRTAERLRKGARVPDARIDLHGMTAERAHRACLRFLAEAERRGDRVVLVITGKGGRGGDGRGLLRDSLPGWLRASPLGHSIIGIYQAHRRHGGEGAFYVYLKRRR